MTRRLPSVGVISEGTLREVDLLDSFAWELKHLAPSRYRGLLRAAGRLLAVDSDDWTPEHQEQAGEVLQELAQALNDVCQPYMYFGAHDGDGCCYGFWPDIDGLERGVREGEVLKVNDTSEVPRSYRGLVVHVNDHGNVTLYYSRRGERRELWSCV